MCARARPCMRMSVHADVRACGCPCMRMCMQSDHSSASFRFYALLIPDGLPSFSVSYFLGVSPPPRHLTQTPPFFVTYPQATPPWLHGKLKACLTGGSSSGSRSSNSSDLTPVYPAANESVIFSPPFALNSIPPGTSACPFSRTGPRFFSLAVAAAAAESATHPVPCCSIHIPLATSVRAITTVMMAIGTVVDVMMGRRWRWRHGRPSGVATSSTASSSRS